MDLIWNTDNIKLLTTCVDNFLTNKGNEPRNGAGQHSFFIISGSKGIGKSSAVQELIRERLGQYFYHDFLWIRDLSDVIGKKHTLKIETPKDKEDRYIPLDPEGKTHYEDIGIREVNHRLTTSPMGKQKVVLIENIERINAAAANAFLKNLEEPLPNRLIIATVSHQSQLLDTIISRAIVIRFQSMLPEAMKEFTTKYADVIQLLRESWHLVEKHNQLKKIVESGTLDAFLDGRIAYCAHHHLPTDKRLDTKQMINNNVSAENALLYAVL